MLHVCVFIVAPPSYPANIRVNTGSNVSVISWERPDFVVTFFGEWIACMGTTVIKQYSTEYQ